MICRCFNDSNFFNIYSILYQTNTLSDFFTKFSEIIFLMDLENIQKKHDPPKTERLYQKMWRAENIKNSLVKLAKISSKNSPTQSPLDCSMMSNTQNISKLTLLSPDKSRQNSILIQGKCNCCQKISKYLSQAKSDKKAVQQKYKELLEKYSELAKQKQQLFIKITQFEKDLQITNLSIEPYKNNVVLMEQHLDVIKQSIVSPNKKSEQSDKMQKQFDQRKKTMDFQFNFLKKTHEREQQNNESKLNRLNFVISYMENKNKQLQAQVTELTRTNKIMHGIIHESGYVVQQRQLFHMASQQLYQYKMQYSKEKKEKEHLARLVDKLRNKIYMLTSLIGYGVVSNIQNNDLHQLSTFKQNLQKMNGIQDRLSLDVYGLLSLKNYKSCYVDVKQFANKDDPWSCLYQPNFLILFEDQQIKNALEENVTTIIKPDFFLLVRAILDSKYSQFLIEGINTNRFSDFTYSFIDFFRLRKKQKRIQINSKRNQQQNDFMKTNFLLRIFDRKVGYLPQIVTFRQFLLKNAPQDQVYYYLMCRNYLFDGPQLDNYISCSDAYNYVSYDRMLARVQQLLEHLDKNSKTIVFNHLNQKKVMKKKMLLIKGNYVLRLLLQVYRKNRKDKITKLRNIFQQTCRFTKCDYIKFLHFKEILRKNFVFLTHSQICQYYRKSIAIMHTQPNATFFQAFSASCIEYIFLTQNLISDEKNKKKSSRSGTEGCNYLMELIPDSVTQLGNQSIYQQYVKYMKNKGLNCSTRIKISQFLLKILQLRLYSVSNCQAEQLKLIQIMDSFNNRLIDIINQNFKRRQKYEQSLEKASSLICKEFKRKIFEFYSQFVKDIKQQINIENKQCV